MKYFVYILYSQKLDKYYVGTTNDIARRVYEHNIGHSKFTRRGVPWELKLKMEFDSKKEADQEERRIKGRKSRRYIEKIIREG